MARPLLTALVAGAALAYLGLHVRRNWSALAAHAWTVRPGWLALSLVTVSSWFVLRARLWQLVVRGLGGELSYRRAFRVWSVAELGRYVPGKVVYVVGRPVLAARVGVRAPVAFASMVVELALVMLSSAVLFAVPLLRSPVFRSHGWVVWVSAGGVLTALAVAIQPRVLSWWLNLGLRWLGKERVEVRLGYGQLVGMFLLCVGLWAGMGLAFAAFARSLWPTLAWGSAPAVAGAYALAWTLGLATVVSPAGLGVREAILVGLLGGVLTPAGAAVVAIGSRLWITVAELACAGVAVALGRTARRPNAGRSGGSGRGRRG